MIFKYINSITYESRKKIPTHTIPVIKTPKTPVTIIAETDFIECPNSRIKFIGDCIRHENNLATIFKRSKSITVNDETIPGIIEWHKNDIYGHTVVVKYKNKYYINIEPIWPDNIQHDDPEHYIGDLVKTKTGKVGVITQYIGDGYYDVKRGNITEKIHIKGML